MNFDKVNVKALAAEFFGTFVLTGAVLASLNGVTAVPTPVLAGVVLSLFVLSVGSVSGTHINPAVTLGLWSVKKVDTATAISYIVSQVAGALLAAAVMQTLIGDAFTNSGIAWFSGFDWSTMLAEALGMGVFTFGIAGAIHNKFEGMTQAWLIGLSLTVGIVFAATIGNGVLNPAVAAGIESLDWSYLVGPILGSIIGFNVYQFMITEKGKL